jgi:hypothetical protein
MTKLFFYTTLLFANFIFGQTTMSIDNLKVLSTNEKMAIYINATSFVTGEKMLYKSTCYNNKDRKPSKISKVGYVMLIDNAKKIIFNHKIFFENGQGQGDFFINTNLVSGNYKLIGYTHWMLNQPTGELFQMPITIINPFQKLEPKEINVLQTNANFNLQSELKNDFLSIETNKKSYNNREKINLKIASKNLEKGTFCLSIRKKDSLDIDLPFSNETNENSKNYVSSFAENQQIILPEIRGEHFAGRITNSKNPLDIDGKTIALSILGESFIYKTVKTNVFGAFVIVLDICTDNKTTIFQVVADDSENYSLVIDPQPLPDIESIVVSKKLEVSQDMKNAIQQRAIASQIENAYFEIKKEVQIPFPKIFPFYKSFDKEYILDDFTKFQDLKETIVEVTTGFNYKFKNNTYQLFAKNSDTNENMEIPALVLVDGVLVSDLKQLFDYPINAIYKISTTQGNFLFDNAQNTNGIVSITTRTLDFESQEKGSHIQKPLSNRPISKKLYYEPNYNMTSLETIPDFRQQLLWIPSLVIDGQEKEIALFASDIKGIFEIKLQGFTSNGNEVEIRDYFRVE